jgi:hypothetical protein
VGSVARQPFGSVPLTRVASGQKSSLNPQPRGLENNSEFG